MKRLKLEEIVSTHKIEAKERKKINIELRGILNEVVDEAKGIAKIKEDGITGLKSYIKNPLYENGDNNKEKKHIKDTPAFYQIRGVDFFLKKKKVLMAHEMGTGKSLIAVACGIELENRLRKKQSSKQLKTLIICPPDMRKTWYDRLHEYIEEPRIGKAVIIDNYKKEKLKEIEDAKFIIASYSAFAFNEKEDNNENRKKLKRGLLKNIDYVILDEVHNAKNPSNRACISKHIKDITNNSEYLCLLSGTPLFNTLPDAYMLISLLEPNHFRTPIEVAASYSKRPDLIRNVLLLRSLRKEAKDIYKLPKLEERIAKISLSKQQRQVYNAIYEKDELYGFQKLQLIKKVLLDPRLLKIGKNNIENLLDKKKINLLDSIEPAKYKRLDKIVRDSIKDKRKIVIFSPLFCNGVTELLEKRYAKYGCLRLDGTNKKEREGIRKDFQEKPEHEVLVATDVAGEGNSLTSASVNVFLDDPYAPGQREQMITRLHRFGQKRNVIVYSLVVPNTVDQGVLEFLEEKDKIIDFIAKKGAPLDKRQKIIMSSLNTINRYVGETPIGRYLYSPGQKLNYLISKMEGLGSEMILKEFKKSKDRIPKFIAKNYPLLLRDRMPANAASLYKQIIEGIEKTKMLENKIDLGSGPSVLSNTLEEEVISVDFNGYNFKQRFNKNKQNIIATMDHIPLKDNYSDLAVCSLALDQTSNKKSDNRTSEREECLREANRILKNGGFYILVMPYGIITKKQIDRWKKATKELGFKTIPYLTGYVNSEDKNFRAYIATLQKIRDPSKNRVIRDLTLEIDKPSSKRIPSQSREGYYNQFYLNGRSLDKCLERSKRFYVS